MKNSSRCMYSNDFDTFINESVGSIYSELDDNYHGDALTTTREAWKAEIIAMQKVVSALDDTNGRIIFEYDIPRLGKRIDVVLLYTFPRS